MVNSAGRPKGGGDARERLLAVARAHAEAGDLDRVSSRSLAVEARVSHTLVNYHFGSRAGLVAETLALRLAPHQVLDAGTDDAGTLDVGLLVRTMLQAWEHPVHGPALAALARTAAAGESRLVVDYLQGAVFDRLAASVGHAAARRAAIAIVGLLFARYVIRVPSIADLSLADAERLLLSMLPARHASR